MRHLGQLTIILMASFVFLVSGCNISPYGVEDSHLSALSGTCASTGNQPGDINQCPNTCPAGYNLQALQFCDPLNGTWTQCTCTTPIAPTPDAGPSSTDGRYCTIGGTGGGVLGWQYQLSPGVYTICVPTDIPLGCVVSTVGVLGAACSMGTGECVETGNYVCDKANATLYCNAVPSAPQAEICDGLDNDCNGVPDSANGSPLICSNTTCYIDADGDGFGTGTAIQVPNGSSCATGQATVNGDCNDAVNTIHPGALEICDLPTGIDNDCDGLVNENLSCVSVDCYEDVDADGFGFGDPVTRLGTTCNAGESKVGNDCAPANAAIHPGATEICNSLDDNCDGTIDGGNTCQSVRCFPDTDGDGFGSGTGTVRTGTTCLAGEVKVGGDCNDASNLVKPGATEICNNADDNCDGTIDDMLVCTAMTCYTDGDMDGFGSGNGTVISNVTQCPAGTSAIFGDCNDSSPVVFPGANEVCNNIDDDCSLRIDDGLTCNGIVCYADADNDGHGAGTANLITGSVAAPASCPTGQVGLNDDCNDANAAIHPGATEICNDPAAIDDDCDGTPNDGLSCASIACFVDTDSDGYGAGTATILNATSCPAGQVTQAGDCNNSNPAVHPNATEICGDQNNVDENCNNVTNDGCILNACYLDNDGDGFGAGTVFTTYAACPAGRVTNNGDCDDTTSLRNPLFAEICDTLDNDCDMQIDDGLNCTVTTCYTDSDSDGYGSGTGFTVTGAGCPAGSSAANLDCNPSNPSVHPNATEVCGNGVDDNCDTLIDNPLLCVTTNCYADTDNDGYGAGTVNVVAGASCPAMQVANNTDCGPSNALVNPGQAENCSTALDDNCNTQVNEGCSTGTTTVSATLNTGRTYVLSGSDVNGIPCPAQPQIISGAVAPTPVAGAACSAVAGGTTVTCSGVPTGVPWTGRACINVGGTVYIDHFAVVFGGACVPGTQGYFNYSSITAGNGSPIGGTTSSGICRNSPL